METKYDVIVVGAGFAGATIANLLARKDKKVLVVEKRAQIGGNMFDYIHTNGVLVHKYGPHIFHTNYKEVFDYLTPDNTGLDNELWTVDAITELAKHGDVIVAKSKGKWVTTGDPKNYFLACLEYALSDTDYADDIRKFMAEH